MSEQPVYRVEPAGPLRGDVRVGGSKNAVAKHMVAAMLGSTPSEIRNAPENREVEITSGMLRSLGVGVDVAEACVHIDPTDPISSRVPLEYTGSNRMPILMLGPMLFRVGEAFVPFVGGDDLGARPLEFHMNGLRALGANVEMSATGIEAKARTLHGARIELPFPSVTATETILLAAVFAEGRTVISGAAIEPEVVELAMFLQRMGALVEIRTDRRIVVEGVDRFNGARHRLSGDRIEAVSYLIAALATGGQVRIFGCQQDGISTAITTLQKMGARFEIHDDWIKAEADELTSGVVHTSPHPGFMTDWHPPLVALFTQARGLSVMHETVFEARLMTYVPALRAMGAEIDVYDHCLTGEMCRFHETGWQHSAIVRGPTRLHGADIEVPDVRAHFTCVVAAAAADGPSVLRGLHELERGYDKPLEKFAELGLHFEAIC